VIARVGELLMRICEVRGQVEGGGSFAMQFSSEYLDEGMEDDE
jgi:hypothetical protein